jgi:hypothetical protein
VTAAQFLTRFVRGCAPLASHAPDTTTGIIVNLTDALNGLECGEALNQVNYFTVALAGAVTQQTGCAESVEFDKLEPDQSYTFAVEAFENSANTPRWTTTCFRTAQKGAVVTAACDPLVDLSLQSADKEQ